MSRTTLRMAGFSFVDQALWEMVMSVTSWSRAAPHPSAKPMTAQTRSGGTGIVRSSTRSRAGLGVKWLTVLRAAHGGDHQAVELVEPALPVVASLSQPGRASCNEAGAS